MPKRPALLQYAYMRTSHRRLVATLFALQFTLVGTLHARDTAPPQPPSQTSRELFKGVQAERLFPDSKTFADATAKYDAAEILRRYESTKSQPGFSLRDFVNANFVIPASATSSF